MAPELSRRSFALLLGGTGLASTVSGGAVTHSLLRDSERATGSFTAAAEFPTRYAWINAGGSGYTAADDTEFVADDHYEGGSAAETGDPIDATSDDVLYQTERYGPGLTYDVPLADGTYDVLLHFTELYWENDGQRVFDVTVEDETLVSNFDIHAEVGHDVATTRAVRNVTVTDGALTIEMSATVDYPKVSAIEVVPSSDGVHVNAGGPATVASDGTLYAADDYDAGGDTYSVESEIDATDDDRLYQSERWGTPLTYDIPVADGAYDVRLHFAEIWHESDGQRIFDVVVEGETVVADLDIHAEVGQNAALVETIQNVEPADGSLTVEMTASQDNAKLSAVDVVPR